MKQKNRYEALQDAILECERFIKAAKESVNEMESAVNSGESVHESSREYAAAKRASMDASNALVCVRHAHSFRLNDSIREENNWL